uniref:Uncharacterized protein n=1 Tax=Anguilla anguilla TaxID=7936 RepID=A0A0E9R5F0_ANGAN
MRYEDLKNNLISALPRGTLHGHRVINTAVHSALINRTVVRLAINCSWSTTSTPSFR